MKMFTIEIYDDETIDKLEKLKIKDITYSDQFPALSICKT